MKKIMSIVTLIVAMSISIVAFATSSSTTRTPHAFVLKDLCIKCGTCLHSCDNGAITIDEEGLPFIDSDKCKGCGECMNDCPEGAIWLEEFGS